MSKYMELVKGKNRFLDYLIDKYNEDPKEGKKEFILQYLDKCSLIEDLNSHFYKEENGTSYYSFYTYMRNTYIKYNNEWSINRILRRYEEDENIVIRITNLNNKSFSFTNKEYYKRFDIPYLNYDEPWIENDANKDIYYNLAEYINETLINDNKDIACLNKADNNLENDYINLDLKQNELVVLAGRPYIGKTTVAINFALNEVRRGGKVLYLTLKDTIGNIGRKIVAINSGIHVWDSYHNELKDEEYHRIIDNMNDLSGIYVVECSCYNIEQIKQAIDNNTIEPTLIIIDDFDSIHYKENYPKCDEEIEYIVKEIRRLLSNHHVTIVVIENTSRNLDFKNDKRPLYLEDLKAPKLGEVADKLYSIYRASYYRYLEEDFIENDENILSDSYIDKLEIINVKEKKTVMCACNSNNVIKQI